MKSKNTGMLTVREPKGSGVVDSLRKLAKKDGRTINNYVMRVLSEHVVAKKVVGKV